MQAVLLKSGSVEKRAEMAPGQRAWPSVCMQWGVAARQHAGEETYRSQERQETGFITEICNRDPHTDCYNGNQERRDLRNLQNQERNCNYDLPPQVTGWMWELRKTGIRDDSQIISFDYSMNGANRQRIQPEVTHINHTLIPLQALYKGVWLPQKTLVRQTVLSLFQKEAEDML